MAKAITYKSKRERKIFAEYYDIFNSKKNYKTEAKFLLDLIAKQFGKCKINILDVGCGTGTHIKYYGKLHNVLGMDINPDMLELAKKKNPGIRFMRGDMRKYKIKRKFDLIISLFSVFGYNLNKMELLMTIRNAYNHLAKGGMLAFDMGLIKDRYPGKSTSTSIDKFNHNGIKLTRIYNSEVHGKIKHFNYVVLSEERGVKDFLYGVHKTGMFSISDVKRILRKSRFSCTVLDARTFKHFGKKSIVPLFVCRKR
jgi:SAM-dependent methyltransferase